MVSRRNRRGQPIRAAGTLGRELAVWEQSNWGMRRAQALTVARSLKEVTAILQQAPNVSICMLAAAGMAQALAIPAPGARQLGAPLPRDVIDAVPELHGWQRASRRAFGTSKVARRLLRRSSEPAFRPPAGPGAGKPRGRVRAQLPGLGRTRAALRSRVMRRRRHAHDRGRKGLTSEERAALELLERAGGHLPGSRWMVGRVAAQSLARHRFVFTLDELVFLTDAGREALIEAQEVEMEDEASAAAELHELREIRKRGRAQGPRT